MTNAPATRKTHVIRILGTNKDDDILPDMWADVERIDLAKSTTQTANVNWQGVVQRLKWQDDPDGGDYNPDGNAGRKTIIVKVCSPDEPNQDDPEEWIPIPVIRGWRLRSSDQRGMQRLVNDEVIDARKVKARRIVHYDTNIDDEATAAFDADSSRKVYVVPGDRYEKNLDTKDIDQYVEHEIIEYVKYKSNPPERGSTGTDQGRQAKLLNQYLIDESEDADLEVKGPNGFNPPFRLDPFQTIVNVQLRPKADVYMLWQGAIVRDVGPTSPGSTVPTNAGAPVVWEFIYGKNKGLLLETVADSSGTSWPDLTAPLLRRDSNGDPKQPENGNDPSAREIADFRARYGKEPNDWGPSILMWIDRFTYTDNIKVTARDEALTPLWETDSVSIIQRLGYPDFSSLASVVTYDDHIVFVFRALKTLANGHQGFLNSNSWAVYGAFDKRGKLIDSGTSGTTITQTLNNQGTIETWSYNRIYGAEVGYVVLKSDI